MATPTAAVNRDRVWKKLMAILIQPAYSGSARTDTASIGNANVSRAKRKVFVSAGVPSAGTGVAAGAFCLDTTNDNVYRYYDSDWDRLDVTT